MTSNSGVRAAVCALAVGIGLGRFAYAPLVPALIQSGALPAQSAVYLGAANLVGYIIGASTAVRLAHRFVPAALLRGLMGSVVLSFAACALPLGIVWLTWWRLLSGIAGGGLMALAAPAVLHVIPAEQRGFATGVIFSAAGVGIVASGTFTPVLLRSGVTAAWLGLSCACGLLTAVAWQGWPAAWPVRAVASTTPAAMPARANARWLAFSIAYAIDALALIPHALFLVDYTVRVERIGLPFGAMLWIVFGFAAIAGPLLSGMSLQRVGARTTFLTLLAMEGAGLLLPLASTLLVSSNPFGSTAPSLSLMHRSGLILSALLIGACSTSVGPATLGRVRELLGANPEAASAAWAAATTRFAAVQAIGAYGMSAAYLGRYGFPLVVTLGMGATVASLILVVAFDRPDVMSRRSGRGAPVLHR